MAAPPSYRMEHRPAKNPCFLGAPPTSRMTGLPGLPGPDLGVVTTWWAARHGQRHTKGPTRVDAYEWDAHERDEMDEWVLSSASAAAMCR